MLNENIPMFSEDIRLIIWDLDETFWEGTLTEGGIKYNDENHELVINLANRGIMSSICSKNNYDQIKQLLIEQNLWDYFIFPSIDWTPKGPRIKSMVDTIGLRPPTVLFIDDNPQNLHQAADMVPGLNIVGPEYIRHIATHPQLQGKNDSKLTRLAQYKALESKELDRTHAGGSEAEFLRKSDIRVYFCYDILGNLDRAIEIINRTNQLNFTKKRLPEDQNQAKAELSELVSRTNAHAALIRVVDKYGDYGYVGLYVMLRASDNKQTLVHFCFSCRTLNMYVEHWLYQYLGRPALKISGEVLSDIKSDNISVNWITPFTHEYSDVASDSNAAFKFNYLYSRGGCNIASLLPYFSFNVNNVVQELNFTRNNIQFKIDHSAILYCSLKGMTEAEKEAAQKLGYRNKDFLTQFLEIPATEGVFLLSFWADANTPLYRHNETGLVLPFLLVNAPNADITTNVEIASRIIINKEQQKYVDDLTAEWSYLDRVSQQESIERYKYIFSRIPKSIKAIILLANEKGTPFFNKGSAFREKLQVIHNETLKLASKEFDNIILIESGDFIMSGDDLFITNHFRRDIYYNIYKHIINIISSSPRS